METWIKEALKKEKERRNLPLEVKSRNGRYYLYKSSTRWDKTLKKRRKVSEYLGKITRKGVVDANSVKFPARTIYEYGNGKLLADLLTEITPALENEFPEEANEILAIGIIKLLQPTPIRLMKSRWEKLYLSKIIPASLSPSIVSKRLGTIGSNWVGQRRFFDTLIKRDSVLLFDLSSIFSYSENLNLAEKGHNADHLFLEQINFALMFDEKRKLPVMLKPMPGSVKDIKSLKNVLSEFELRDCSCVMDRGFADINTLPDLFDEKDMKFILPLKRNFTIVNYDVEFEGSFTYGGRGINWAKTSINGKFLYLFQDVKLRGEEETTFIKLIEEGKRTREEMKVESKKFGKVALLTSIVYPKTTAKDVYLMFKSREDIEQAFDVLKNELENDKTYLSDTDAVRGYFFVSFISLYLYYRIYNILAAYDRIGKISVAELLFELSKVYLVEYTNGQKLLSEVTARATALSEGLKLDLFPTELQS